MSHEVAALPFKAQAYHVTLSIDFDCTVNVLLSTYSNIYLLSFKSKFSIVFLIDKIKRR